jgi:transposase
MIWLLLVGYCYGIRQELRLCQEVALHLAYRWFASSISTTTFRTIQRSR